MDETANSTTMAPSVQKALETPELLENVLSHLDMQTLLVSAPRVSRSWNALISSSPTLQKALFLQIDDSNTLADGVGGEDELPARQRRRQLTRPHPNPLLMKAFPLWFRETQTRSSLFATSYSDSDSDSAADSDPDHGSDDPDASNSNSGTNSNPSTGRAFTVFEHPDSSDSEANDDDDDDDEGWDLLFPFQSEYSKQPFASSERKVNAFECLAASWRRMLVYQAPPIRTIAVWERVTSDARDDEWDDFNCTVFCVDGVRTKWDRELAIGAVETKIGGGEKEETRVQVVEGGGVVYDDSGNGEIESSSRDLGGGVGDPCEDEDHDASDGTDWRGGREGYEDVFRSLEEWKAEGEQGGRRSSSSVATDEGLRMSDYFNFTVYQACRAGARKVAHWSWAGAGGGHYLRKSGRGLGRFGPIPLEVRIIWDEVADGVDLVLSSSYKEGWSATERRQHDLANIEFLKKQEGMKSPVLESGGLKKVWHWGKHYGASEA